MALLRGAIQWVDGIPEVEVRKKMGQEQANLWNTNMEGGMGKGRWAFKSDWKV